jgi:hypothetical protein
MMGCSPKRGMIFIDQQKQKSQGWGSLLVFDTASPKFWNVMMPGRRESKHYNTYKDEVW